MATDAPAPAQPSPSDAAAVPEPSPAAPAETSPPEPAAPSEPQPSPPAEVEEDKSPEASKPAEAAPAGTSEPAPQAPTVPVPEGAERAESLDPPDMTEAEVMDFLRDVPAEAAEEPPIRITFAFRYQPWEDVLDEFAQHARLSLLFETLPPGTCNYVDDREYTPAEAIDVLNSLLLIKGYTLIRRERMLIVVNLEDLEDGVPPNLVTTVPVEEIDQLGKYELVSTVFQLENVTAEEAQAEIVKLLGPQGSVVPLPRAQRIVVTETGGQLRTIRDAIQRIEDPKRLASQQLRSFPLDLSLAEEVLAILRQLFGIADDKNAAEDGSIRFALDPLGMRLIAFGKASKLDQVAEILTALEASNFADVQAEGVEAALQLEVYTVAPADPESVLQVMQTLLSGSPGARLSTDQKTGNLVALARPEDQATIRATLDQMRNESNRVEVFQLRGMDPQLAVLSITKLFGGGEDSPFKVDADPTSRRLIIRGSEAEIEQIRAWLEQMGESDTAANPGSIAGDTMRVVPLTGRSATSALELLQQMWPAIHPNKIRVVTPSAALPSFDSELLRSSSQTPEALLNELFFNTRPPIRVPAHNGLPPAQADPPQATPDPSSVPEPAAEPAPEPQPAPPADESPSANASPPENRSAAVPRPTPRPRVILVSTTQQPEIEVEPGPETQEEQEEAVQPPVEPTPEPTTAEPPEIVVIPGPGGIMIASDDVEALDNFEDLLTALAAGAASKTSDMTIFYLVHAEATTVGPVVSQLLSGSTLASTGRSGESALGELAGAAFGLGGGSLVSSGSVQITPVDRLNALIVQANPADTDTIDQLLEILDQKQGPVEVLVQAKPRPIPLFNTVADEVAEIVREVYQDRMATSSSRGRQPSPMEMFEAMRGRSSRGGSSRSTTQDTQKMSIGVDGRTNSLIVSAPEALFEEVRDFVEGLDEAAMGSSNQTLRVVTLRQTNTEAVQKALETLVGDSVQFSGSSRSRGSSSSGGRPGSGSPVDDMRRMMIMRAMQGGGGPPGFGSGRPSFGGDRSSGGRPSSGFGGRPSSGFGGRPSSGFGGGGPSRGGGGRR